MILKAPPPSGTLHPALLVSQHQEAALEPALAMTLTAGKGSGSVLSIGVGLGVGVGFRKY